MVIKLAITPLAASESEMKSFHQKKSGMVVLGFSPKGMNLGEARNKPKHKEKSNEVAIITTVHTCPYTPLARYKNMNKF